MHTCMYVCMLLTHLVLINYFTKLQNRDVERENEIASKLAADTNNILNPVMESMVPLNKYVSSRRLTSFTRFS